jgi:predicted TIM-barrel enzyme
MFKPGQSGNLKGRPKRADIVTQALIIALNEIDPETDKKRVRMLADKLVEKACSGDVAAANAVMDRVEGKAAQAVTLQGNEDGGPVSLQIVLVGGSVPAPAG